jgi:hypothetical protein
MEDVMASKKMIMTSLLLWESDMKALHRCMDQTRLNMADLIRMFIREGVVTAKKRELIEFRRAAHKLALEAREKSIKKEEIPKKKPKVKAGNL